MRYEQNCYLPARIESSMKLPKYHLKAETGFTRFEFISEGDKGAIRKLIEFQATTDPEVFNLAFGDKDLMTDEMDDLSVTNNGDTEKVLATVVASLYVFFDNLRWSGLSAQ